MSCATVIFEIRQVNNDVTNLLSSIEIAVVIVGSDLTIRRFTPEAQKIPRVHNDGRGSPTPEYSRADRNSRFG